MEKFKDFAVFAENLKSFGSERQGFESIKNVNIIVGRNNSGKSSLIDLIAYATEGSMSFPENHWHEKNESRIITETRFNINDANHFPSNHSGGMITGSHNEYGKKLIGSLLTTHIQGNNRGTLISCDSSIRYPKLEEVNYRSSIENSPQRNLLQGMRFHRLAAERNIVPEGDFPEMRIESTGVGATNMIQHFINKSHLPSDLVEKTLLGALNLIFAPDAVFTDIVCQHHTSNHWEIFLEEENKGRIALSQSGSGLKTVILVLAYIHLLPTVFKEPLSKFVFAFEELENNLHPALQRRLLSYIATQSVANNFPVFLTTHSSVAIDMFSKRHDAQIIHVTHSGKSATAKRISTYVENKGILDDLDLRASDLLQANGIIWVEGPSDRIYINRWIDLVSKGRLTEGTHYQCIFYGGRLLSHLSAESPDQEYDGIPLLTINRNAAIVIDSDRRNEEDDLNQTKKRIISEFASFEGFTWVTSGREIENYNSDSLLKKWIPSDAKFKIQRNKYRSFFEHLNSMQSGLGDKYEGKKPLLAEQLSQLMSIEDVETDNALYQKVNDLCKTIRHWNKISTNI
jgi:hypothetical protein